MPESDGHDEGAALPREVQEHLGRKLRSSLETEAPKPTFLGESDLPPRFESLLRQLEAGGRAQGQGYEAVRRALEEEPAAETDRPPRRDG